MTKVSQETGSKSYMFSVGQHGERLDLLWICFHAFLFSCGKALPESIFKQFIRLHLMMFVDSYIAAWWLNVASLFASYTAIMLILQLHSVYANYLNTYRQKENLFFCALCKCAWSKPTHFLLSTVDQFDFKSTSHSLLYNCEHLLFFLLPKHVSFSVKTALFYIHTILWAASRLQFSFCIYF